MHDVGVIRGARVGGRVAAFGLALLLAGAAWSQTPSDPLQTPPKAREEAALLAFLRKTLPKGSHYRREGKIELGGRSAKILLEGARPLPHFEPYRLIELSYWSPVAGPPGQVLEDHRILWDQARGRFRLGSRAFLSRYRKAHPLEIVKFTDAELGAYFEEVASILPWVDRWSPKLEILGRPAPLRLSLEIRETGRMDQLLAGPEKDLVQFAIDGNVTRSSYLDRDRGPDP